MDNKNLQTTNHDFLIYRDSNNDVKVSVMLINNDIWLTQNLIAELFGVGRSTITEHINNILNSGELDENNTVGKTDIDNSTINNNCNDTFGDNIINDLDKYRKMALEESSLSYEKNK